VSLYREPGRVAGRTLGLVAAAALLAGAIGGYVVGRETAPNPTLADKVADLRARLQPARQGIELTATEYSQAVRHGRVVARTEYKAAQEDVGRAREAIAASRADLRTLGPARAATVERRFGALAGAVQRRASPAAVTRLSRATDAAIVAAVGA
jgi:hypothetical protein